MGHDSEKLKKNVEDAQKLLDALDRAKTPAPAIVRKILEAMQEGVELSMSAEEASKHLANFIKEIDRQCGIGNSSVDQDDAYICLAKREHTDGSLSYKSRVNYVLNIKNPDSMVNIHWSKMKRSGWACIWDELRNGNPSGLYRKCFIPKGKAGHLPKHDEL